MCSGPGEEPVSPPDTAPTGPLSRLPPCWPLWCTPPPAQDLRLSVDFGSAPALPAGVTAPCHLLFLLPSGGT